MTLTPIHDRLARTVLLYLLILSLWGFWRFFRRQGLNSNYWGSLAIGEGLILIQGILGIILWFNSMRPERGGVHILYGVVGAIGIPAVYLFTKGRDQRQEMIVYAAVLLFLVGVSLRSMFTG